MLLAVDVGKDVGIFDRVVCKHLIPDPDEVMLRRALVAALGRDAVSRAGGYGMLKLWGKNFCINLRNCISSVDMQEDGLIFQCFTSNLR